MKIKQILEVLKSRSVLGAILFAIALWGYTRLNGTYQARVDLEFEVNPPTNRAVTESLPDKITVEFSGTGWDLFNYIHMNASKRCYVDLSDVKISSDEYRMTRNDFLKGLEALENISPEYFTPNTITLRTGSIAQKKVPIESRLQIKTAEKYSRVGPPKFFPDSVIISGPEDKIKEITSWPTQSTVFSDVTRPVTDIASLLDTLEDIIELSRNTVEFVADIQQSAERTFYDIPIVFRGSSLPKNHIITPQYLSITVQSGIDVISDIMKNEIKFYIEYSQIINDSTGIIEPTLKLPPYVKAIDIVPPFVYHFKEEKRHNLSEFID